MSYQDPAGSSWSALRATRWRPPGAASHDEGRSATYVFALEQAEQMFRAATTVGPPVRPLLLFYGLSQAGRAIAAAAVKLNAADWQLKGHGIAAANLTDPLAEIPIGCDRPVRSGSFTRLSELLGSPLWDKTARPPLRAFWDAIPENRLAPLVDDDNRRTPLEIDLRCLVCDDHPLASLPVFPFPPRVIGAPSRKALEEYLVSFPAASGFDSYVRLGPYPDSPPDFAQHPDGWGELYMNWDVDKGRHCSFSEQAEYMSSITRPYLGSQYFFPALASSGKSIHPLMAWWAVLFTLSMLARYEPSRWGAYININESPVATMLENLLREGIRALPKLIAETIDEVI